MGESLTQRRRVRDEGLRIVNLLYGKLEVKSHGSTVELPSKLPNWSAREDSGIPGVGVKSVDIWKNISGEGGYLARN